jgi:hypothetical protein
VVAFAVIVTAAIAVLIASCASICHETGCGILPVRQKSMRPCQDRRSIQINIMFITVSLLMSQPESTAIKTSLSRLLFPRWPPSPVALTKSFLLFVAPATAIASRNSSESLESSNLTRVSNKEHGRQPKKTAASIPVAT